tara:strand:- start:1125 stop:1781 length:657 start_codon:yes stop_codon:yes gene_type:complete
LNAEHIEGLFSRIDPGDVKEYSEYWKTITPEPEQDPYMKRWLFAFLSIHTGWKKNKEAYMALKDHIWEWGCREDIEDALRECKTGLYTSRSKGLWGLRKAFKEAHKNKYSMGFEETWASYRDRHVDMLYGIGMAKVSFAFELCFPETARVVCLDTHLLQMYGYKPNSTVGKKAYHEMEKHWLGQCTKYNYPSPISRHIIWDQLQGKQDTRYWSHVFEE